MRRGGDESEQHNVERRGLHADTTRAAMRCGLAGFGRGWSLTTDDGCTQLTSTVTGMGNREAEANANEEWWVYAGGLNVM